MRCIFLERLLELSVISSFGAPSEGCDETNTQIERRVME